MAIYDIWSWPLALVEEARSHWIFRRVSRSPANSSMAADGVVRIKHDQKGLELRVDNLGRIFTVVNVPEEMREEREGMEDMHMAYVIDQLNAINFVLMRLRLSDVSYPTVERIEGTWSYLVVVSASPGDVLTWGNLFTWASRVVTLAGVYYLADRVCVAMTGSGIVGNVLNLLG